MNTPIIIIPDVYGRDFWRLTVAQCKEEDTLVFLQDNGPRVIDHSLYCLDCKRAFVLNTLGEIEQI